MKILLQILIITIFIFSNGYQGLVTSFMLQPAQHKLLKSVDDFLKSDIKIHGFFYHQLLTIPKYQNFMTIDRKAKHDCTVINNPGKALCGDLKISFIAECSFKKIMENFGNGKSYLGMYQIPEVVFTERLNLFVPASHPFVDKFQYFMDLSFEAGLPIAWERFYREYINLRFMHEKNERNTKEMQILDFGAIRPFFLILVFGFALALLVLLCEIFKHDFLRLIDWKMLEKIFCKIFLKKISKRKRRKPIIQRKK